MIKYFQVYEYESNLKARLAVYQLQGKATLWWEETKMVHAVDEKTITWEDFQTKFKSRYLNERYYDDKAKEFHELRLGQLTMDEFVTKFTNLLRYVPYIREEKAKLQKFLNCLPTVYKEKIEFDNPNTMDEAVRKAILCYQQFKGKAEQGKSWMNKGEFKGKRPKPAYLRNFGRDHQRKKFSKPK